MYLSEFGKKYAAIAYLCLYFLYLFVLLTLSFSTLAPAVIYVHFVSPSPPFSSFPSLHHYLFFSVSSSCACNPVMGYCFSNLADRGQYLCIVFQYPFLMLTWAPVWPRHKSTTETQSYSPLPSYYVLPSLPSTDTQFFFFSERANKGQRVGFHGIN